MQPARSTTPVESLVRERPAMRPAAPSTISCSCGHEKQAHMHYRRGTDCAFCDCAHYHRPLLRRLPAR
jgi:hypothetical protein